MRTRLLKAAIPILVAAFLPPAAVQAQTRIVDEGSFTVTRGGRTGREDFRIVRQPIGSGAALVASGTAVAGTGRVVTVLRADSAGAPLGFQLEARDAGEVTERIVVEAGRDRVATRSQSLHGESAREYFLRPGMLVFDEGAVHEYYFLTLLRRDSVAAVLPRRNELTQLRVSSKGDEALEIAGTRVVATHYVISDAAGERHLWTDSSGRVLRLEVPSLALTAVRDALPADR